MKDQGRLFEDVEEVEDLKEIGTVVLRRKA